MDWRILGELMTGLGALLSGAAQFAGVVRARPKRRRRARTPPKEAANDRRPNGSSVAS